MLHYKSSRASDISSPHPDSPVSIALPRLPDGPPPAKAWPPAFIQAMVLALQGRDYAEQEDRDNWDFALEIDDLRKLGLTNNDLRWMVCKGWVEHAREVGEDAQRGRVFAASGELSFDGQTCFILTEEGIEIARHLTRGHAMLDPPEELFRLNGAPGNGRHATDVTRRPRWNPEFSRLEVGGELVKEFKLPSPNQGTILMAFEEEGWPGRIDDPLPPSPEIDSKQRLRYTIKSLNKNQKKRLIRFKGDGSGEGVLWELITTDEEP